MWVVSIELNCQKAHVKKSENNATNSTAIDNFLKPISCLFFTFKIMLTEIPLNQKITHVINNFNHQKAENDLVFLVRHASKQIIVSGK